jgi:hypothetical protein
VKVYRLNDQGTWDDGGTGYVQLHSDEVGSYFQESLSFLLCMNPGGTAKNPVLFCVFYGMTRVVVDAECSENDCDQRG